jgi:hypothetical protein
MIPVSKVPEPRGFKKKCKDKGLEWLDANPGKRKGFPAYWTAFQPKLADGFHNRCGWWAMEIEDGAVDHYLSKWNHRDKAYDWGNYRYIAGSVNSSKRNHDDAVLDPYEVQEGWFEVLLPSMQLRRTDAVPVHLRAKADFTIRQLKLSTAIKVRRNRRRWYEAYKKYLADPNKGLTLGGLEEIAPLVAAAVKRWEATGQPLP